MKTYDITLSSGKTVSLRLSSIALANFCKTHGIDGAPPLASVLAAADNAEARNALFTAALRCPGVHNDPNDGATLLDLLVDEGYRYNDISNLIVQLCVSCGLLDEEDLEAVKHGAVSTYDRLVKALAGLNQAEQTEQAETATAEKPEENPTEAEM